MIRLTGASWVTLAFWVIVWAAFCGPRPGQAYELHPFRWEGALVYENAPEIDDALVDAAVAEWTDVSSLRARRGSGGVTILFERPIYFPAAAAEAVPVTALGVAQGGTVLTCTIRINPNTWVTYQLRLLVHELGHCLGLYHSPEPSVMRAPGKWGITGDDIAGIWELFPPLVATSYVGGLTR